ncbi:head maturation protease, ClpP-related [Streptomyces viridochromogenes]|uniref:head maturation protease, ClpP-related n=1 Tax=Streptomyces viridochromogenes TaxID=1938 RepID=UPI00069E5751|nr:head maturation protease, ClpP-related [Streptomyces viridochromogenes]
MPFIDLPDRIPGVRAQASSDRPWYRITNQAADEAEVMLYDEVGGWLGATADEFINDLRGITASKILLRVNSPGGSVTEGIAIANALRSHPASVTVQVDGVAASIASVIAMAGDRVRMMPNALLMVHEASGLCVGEAADMIKMAELLDKISDNIAGAYAARAGGTEAEWRQVMKNETWYRGEEAVAAGLADEYVSVPKRGDEPAEPEMRKAFDLTAYGYKGPRREEPKPAPPPVAPEAVELTLETATLSEDIRSLIGEEVAAQLRAAVGEPGLEEPAVSAPAEPPVVEPAPESKAHTEPPAEPVVPAAEPEDPWAAMVAHLTQDEPDAWSVLVSNLTTTASSSAATEA